MMTVELQALIDAVRNHVWSDEEKRQHIISFAYGNVKLHNDKITREMIEREYDKLQAGRKDKK